MDEEFSLSSFCSPLSPSAAFSAAGNPVIEFTSCDIPEQWLLGNNSAWAFAGSSSVLRVDTPTKQIGRKPVQRSYHPASRNTEAERQRRENLNRLFYDLRAAVPKVSRMDKASILADAIAYIAELRGRVEKLEVYTKQAASAQNELTAQAPTGAPGMEEQLEVRMVQRQAAAVRLTTAAHHATARLMVALRELDLRVQHASVSRLGAVTVLDAVVDVPAGSSLQDESCLRASLLYRMLES